MRRKEFIAAFTQHRRAALIEMYKNKPHGPACLAMSLVDLDAEVQRIWRKHQAILRTESLTDFRKRIDKARKEASAA